MRAGQPVTFEDRVVTPTVLASDAELRDLAERGGVVSPEAWLLAERAGLDVRIEVVDMWTDPGEATRVFSDPDTLTWMVDVTAPAGFEDQIAAMVWDNRSDDTPFASILHRHTNRPGWQLSRFDERGPYGHSDLTSVIDAFDTLRSGVRYGEQLLQVVFKDGTVLVRDGAAPVEFNPADTSKLKRRLKR